MRVALAQDVLYSSGMNETQKLLMTALEGSWAELLECGEMTQKQVLRARAKYDVLFAKNPSAVYDADADLVVIGHVNFEAGIEGPIRII